MVTAHIPDPKRNIRKFTSPRTPVSQVMIVMIKRMTISIRCELVSRARFQVFTYIIAFNLQNDPSSQMRKVRHWGFRMTCSRPHTAV